MAEGNVFANETKTLTVSIHWKQYLCDLRLFKCCIHFLKMMNLKSCTSYHHFSYKKEFGLEDKLGKQKFQEDMKIIFELLTDTVKDDSKEVTETTSETSKRAEKQLQTWRKKFEKYWRKDVSIRVLSMWADHVWGGGGWKTRHVFR